MNSLATSRARKRITQEERERYLDALRTDFSHVAASRIAGHPNTSFEKLRERDSDFARQCEEARNQVRAGLLKSALQLATEGEQGALILDRFGDPIKDPDDPSRWLRKPRRRSTAILLALIEKLGPVIEPELANKKSVEVTHTGTVVHAVASPPHIARQLLEALEPTHQIEVRKKIVELAFARGEIDAERRLDVLANIATDAEEWGITLDLRAFAALPSPDSADAVDAEFEEVDPDMIELKTLF